MKCICPNPLIVAVAIGLTAITPQSTAAQNPSITRVEAANGSFNTADRVVTLGITASGTPTAYRASETRDFTGASWHSFTASPSFTLSSALGFKTVFVQVGRAPTVSSPTVTRTTSATTSATTSLPGDLVMAPTYLSNVMADTIVLGLPDLQSTVEMPTSVHDNAKFDFWVTVKNAGQINPPAETIQVYNSFVTNTISLESVDVPFGVSRLVGQGCRITDTPTIECSVAPIAPNGAVGIHVFAQVRNAIPSGQTSISWTLRTRITGVRESNTTNNWRDTKITIVK
jgi:hypothetical protein